MNSFLNRVLAPGLRRVGAGFGSSRKAEPAVVAPMITEPAVEEIADEQPAGSMTSRLVQEDTGGREEFEAASIEERPSGLSDEIHMDQRADAPERLSQRRSPEEESFFEEKVSSHPIVERPRPGAEIFSFEAVEFNPSTHPSLRRFRPSGEKLKTEEASARSKSDAGPDQTALREIVWEVVPMDRKTSSPKQKVYQAPPSEVEPSQVRSSDPMQPPPSVDPSPQRAAKNERALDLSPRIPPVSPRGATLPRPSVRPPEEKGDLIIEQLEVRVVAEPERKPEPPKVQRATPKRSGAWETAARYYLGKV